MELIAGPCSINSTNTIQPNSEAFKACKFAYAGFYNNENARSYLIEYFELRPAVVKKILLFTIQGE